MVTNWIPVFINGTAPKETDKKWRKMHLFCDKIKSKEEKESEKMEIIEERKKILELYYNEGKTQKEMAKTMNLSVNTIKSWIRRSRLKNFNKESTDNQINDEIKLI